MRFEKSFLIKKKIIEELANRRNMFGFFFFYQGLEIEKDIGILILIESLICKHIEELKNKDISEKPIRCLIKGLE
jgi:hypothetical protein